MKIIDCFPFFDEFMILDIRFREIYDLVDKFIIVESPETFNGKNKPLYLSECLWERFPKYADKVEIIVAPAVNYWNAWDREYAQKNHISKENLRHLNLDDNDIILTSDADEIPRRSVLINLIKNGFRQGGEAFELETSYYKFNIKSSEIVDRSKYIQYLYMTDHTHMRYQYYPPVIPNAGWHLTSIKSPEDIHKKIDAFSHQEYNLPEISSVEVIKEKIDSMTELFTEDDRRPYSLRRVDIDDSFPEFVKENRESLSEWIA